MRVILVPNLKVGMTLAQNVFRHDGLLAYTKGTPIGGIQKRAFDYLRLEYVMVYENGLTAKEDDTNFSLQILESAFRSASVWTEEFGRELYRLVSKRIIQNKRVCQYLNQLRVLDSYSYAHCINISIIVALLLHRNWKVDGEIADIAYLALIHDIGRIQMKGIFEKEGKLTDEEFEKLRKHPEVSFKLLKKAGLSPYDIQFVLETHEKYDGSGYPLQLSRNDINDLAQLVFVADVYNALSSYRPYRSVFSPYEVVEMIELEKNKSFGEEFVHLFMRKFQPYRIGEMVELSNGGIGVIKGVSAHHSLLPVVEILSPLTGERIDTVDLRFHPHIRIVRIVQD